MFFSFQINIKIKSHRFIPKMFSASQRICIQSYGRVCDHFSISKFSIRDFDFFMDTSHSQMMYIEQFSYKSQVCQCSTRFFVSFSGPDILLCYILQSMRWCMDLLVDQLCHSILQQLGLVFLRFFYHASTIERECIRIYMGGSQISCGGHSGQSFDQTMWSI